MQAKETTATATGHSVIQWILHVRESKRDIYGNRYFFQTLYCTTTGKSLTFQTNTRDNILFDLRRLFSIDWKNLKQFVSVLPIREFNRLQKISCPDTYYHAEKMENAIKGLTK